MSKSNQQGATGGTTAYRLFLTAMELMQQHQGSIFT